jgi:hypothetical protein
VRHVCWRLFAHITADSSRKQLACTVEIFLGMRSKVQQQSNSVVIIVFCRVAYSMQMGAVSLSGHCLRSGSDRFPAFSDRTLALC